MADLATGGDERRHLEEEIGWHAVVSKIFIVILFADIWGDFDLGGVQCVFVYLSAELEGKREQRRL